MSLSKHKKTLERIVLIRKTEEEIQDFFVLFQEDPQAAEDKDLQIEFTELFVSFKNSVSAFELESFLSDPYDFNDAIVNLYAGAGGTDAQDWSEMLLRMYLRWFEKKGYKVEVLDKISGDEAGIKSVSLLVSGDYVYGYLKLEKGVHRLVRQSPFNANNKRQTSFAAVDVIPKLDTQKSVSIDPKDLKIDTYRASGAGGQHVNKTDSAIRITHLPTGLVSTCQSSRSQNSNKEMAMNILMSRLMVVLEQQQKDKLSEISGDKLENTWGYQIRSYVLHPYKLVKDLRTNFETSNVQDVLNGNLDSFINAMLRTKKR
jgi:peptide chain release factor 2